MVERLQTAVVICAFILTGCAEAIDDKHDKTTATSITEPPKYYTSMPLREFMTDVISHSAYEVWNRQGLISDESGITSLFPKNSEEWADARSDSLVLAELTNSLLLPERRIPEKEWDIAVAKVRNAALNLARASEIEDEDRFFELGEELDLACKSCHQTYAKDVD